MALVPFAVKKLIPPGSTDPRITATTGILHVDAGNTYDLHDFFNGRSGGIESHFHIPKDGVLFQYRDTAFQADANYLANPFALSFETQGFGDGEWTDEQLFTIKRSMLWCKEEHNIPLRVTPAWNAPGWGYHIMWGSPGKWTNVAKACPGRDRIEQFHDILVPWMATNPTSPEEDVANTKEEIQSWVANTPIQVGEKGEFESLQKVLRRLHNREVNARKIAEAVAAALPAEQGRVQVDQIEQAVANVLRKGVGEDV